MLVSPDLSASEASTSKRLGLLRDVVPGAKIIGLLVNRPEATDSETRELEGATGALGLTFHIVHAGNERELDDAFANLAQTKVDALLVNTGPFFRTRTEQLVSLAARYATPAIYSGRDYAVSGGLMGYGPSLIEAYRHEGNLCGKNPQRRKTRRSAGHAVDYVRVRDQHEDCAGFQFNTFTWSPRHC